MVSCDGFVFSIATKENSHFLCCNNVGQCHETDLQMGDKFLMVSLLFFILSPAAKSPMLLIPGSSCIELSVYDVNRRKGIVSLTDGIQNVKSPVLEPLGHHVSSVSCYWRFM
jgi:hypothetical protein